MYKPMPETPMHWPAPAEVPSSMVRSVLLNKHDRLMLLNLVAQKGVDPTIYLQRLMESAGVTAEDMARADAPVLEAEAMIAALPPAGFGEL